MDIGCARSQKNFGKPVEWALVKDYAWSTPQLRKLDKPVRGEGGIEFWLEERCCDCAWARDAGMSHVHWTATARVAHQTRNERQKCPFSTFKIAQVDVDGNPWPLDASGNPITK